MSFIVFTFKSFSHICMHAKKCIPVHKTVQICRLIIGDVMLQPILFCVVLLLSIDTSCECKLYLLLNVHESAIKNFPEIITITMQRY